MQAWIDVDDPFLLTKPYIVTKALVTISDRPFYKKDEDLIQSYVNKLIAPSELDSIAKKCVSSWHYNCCDECKANYMKEHTKEESDRQYNEFLEQVKNELAPRVEAYKKDSQEKAEIKRKQGIQRKKDKIIDIILTILTAVCILSGFVTPKNLIGQMSSFTESVMLSEMNTVNGVETSTNLDIF